jgi:hypothetical protein
MYQIIATATTGLSTAGNTAISNITAIPGFPAMPSNMTVSFLNSGTGASSKNYIIFTLDNITTGTNNPLYKQLVWPVTCFINPLSTPVINMGNITDASMMSYSNSNLVTKPAFQGSVTPNTPIVGSTATAMYLDIGFKSGANMGTNLTSYMVTSDDIANKPTFLGAFIYITFNNAALNYV